MLCTDRIIVLSHTRFSDSSIIVRALSRQHGRVSLMVYGFGGKSRSKLGAFHPMALLDVVYSYKPDRDIQKLTEYRPAPNLVSCTADLRKSSLSSSTRRCRFLSRCRLGCSSSIWLLW